MTTSREEILARLDTLETRPVAIQALWDGDSIGWYIQMSAITEDGERHQLGGISEGGDIRLFKGEVPPWPEAEIARQLGSELAEKSGAEFYFPSPDHPEDDCPDWRDRDKGYPCRRCGILLLQRPDSYGHGICHFCYIEEQREQREATWTEEERAGPRCFMCGNPAKTELDGKPCCAACFDKYEVHTCERCKTRGLLTKTSGYGPLCRSCEIQESIDSLSAEQRDRIRTAMEDPDMDKAPSLVIDFIGCNRSRAYDVVHKLSISNQSDTTE